VYITKMSVELVCLGLLFSSSLIIAETEKRPERSAQNGLVIQPALANDPNFAARFQSSGQTFPGGVGQPADLYYGQVQQFEEDGGSFWSSYSQALNGNNNIDTNPLGNQYSGQNLGPGTPDGANLNRPQKLSGVNGSPGGRGDLQANQRGGQTIISQRQQEQRDNAVGKSFGRNRLNYVRDNNGQQFPTDGNEQQSVLNSIGQQSPITNDGQLYSASSNGQQLGEYSSSRPVQQFSATTNGQQFQASNNIQRIPLNNYNQQYPTQNQGQQSSVERESGFQSNNDLLDYPTNSNEQLTSSFKNRQQFQTNRGIAPIVKNQNGQRNSVNGNSQLGLQSNKGSNQQSSQRNNQQRYQVGTYNQQPQNFRNIQQYRNSGQVRTNNQQPQSSRNGQQYRNLGQPVANNQQPQNSDNVQQYINSGKVGTNNQQPQNSGNIQQYRNSGQVGTNNQQSQNSENRQQYRKSGTNNQKPQNSGNRQQYRNTGRGQELFTNNNIQQFSTANNVQQQISINNNEQQFVTTNVNKPSSNDYYRQQYQERNSGQQIFSQNQNQNSFANDDRVQSFRGDPNQTFRDQSVSSLGNRVQPTVGSNQANVRQNVPQISRGRFGGQPILGQQRGTSQQKSHSQTQLSSGFVDGTADTFQGQQDSGLSNGRYTQSYNRNQNSRGQQSSRGSGFRETTRGDGQQISSSTFQGQSKGGNFESQLRLVGTSGSNQQGSSFNPGNYQRFPNQPASPNQQPSKFYAGNSQSFSGQQLRPENVSSSRPEGDASQTQRYTNSQQYQGYEAPSESYGAPGPANQDYQAGAGGQYAP